MAALAAAREGGRVTVYEATSRVGASILASGNGRCNLSNARVDAAAYRNAAFVRRAFEALPPQQVLSLFSELGLLLREEDDGRLYPLTNKATSVLDVLRFALEEAGVTLVCDLRAESVTPAGATTLVKLSDGTAAFFDRVIVAAGGAIARRLLPARYPFNSLEPRLCPLITDAASVKGLENIRVRCEASLIVASRGVLRAGASTIGTADTAADSIAIERGEVLFRKHGVSGIAVFNLSRFARLGDVISLNLLPDTAPAATQRLVGERVQMFPDRPAERQLAGMVLPAVARAVLRQAHVDAQHPLTAADAVSVAAALQGLTCTIEGFDARSCQVHRGGFAVESFAADTMESKADPGLYVVGEALDVDGPCGGYNLHWAWTSGLLAGKAAVR